MTRSPGINALVAEAGGLRCFACDGPLPAGKTRRRVICRAPDCARLHQQIYSQDRWAARRSMLSPAGLDLLMANARTLRSIANQLMKTALILSVGDEPPTKARQRRET